VRVRRVVVMGVTCLLAVVFLAACGAGSGGDDSVVEVPASPKGKVEVANFNGVHSGEAESTLRIRQEGEKPEEFNLRILGPFLKAGEEALPQLDPAIESNGDLAGRHVEFLSGPLVRAEKWVVNFDGKVYEPNQKAFEGMKAKFEDAQEEEGSEGNAMACIEAAEDFEVTDILENLSYEGPGEALDGAKLQTVGADLDAVAAIDELIKLSEGSPGCKAQLEAIGVPPAAELQELEKELERSLADARMTISIDKNGVVRDLKILAHVEQPRDEELEVELAMRLNRVNEVTSLPLAHGYSPYPDLLKQFGLDEEDVEQADAGEIYVGILEVLSDRLFGREEG
jgi:hypothetical protein